MMDLPTVWRQACLDSSALVVVPRVRPIWAVVPQSVFGLVMGIHSLLVYGKGVLYEVTIQLLGS